jgi:hypothetical protein
VRRQHGILALATPRHDIPIAMSKPTAKWEKVGDKFYRKVQLYTAVFDQDLELDKHNVVGAPYSGAVGGYAAASGLSLYRIAKQRPQLSSAMRLSCTRTAGPACPRRASTCTAARASWSGASTWALPHSPAPLRG